MSKQSLWIHKGAGHYIGSLIIVSADSKETAEIIMREKLDSAGLKSEPLEVKPLEVKENFTLIFDNGDY